MYAGFASIHITRRSTIWRFSLPFFFRVDVLLHIVELNEGTKKSPPVEQQIAFTLKQRRWLRRYQMFLSSSQTSAQFELHPVEIICTRSRQSNNWITS